MKEGIKTRIASAFKMQIIGIIVLISIIGFTTVACSGKAAPASDFSYDLTADGKGIKITHYTGKRSGTLVFPSTIEDMPVLEIADGFGGYTSSITSVVIPSSVVRIGNNALHSEYFNKVTLSEGLKIIGDYAFLDSSITTIKLPDSLEEIGMGAFAKCFKLTSVNLPKNLKTIRSNAFLGCMELAQVTIPATLQNVNFPPPVESTDTFTSPVTENNAFNFCQKLPLKTRQAIQNLGYKDDF